MDIVFDTDLINKNFLRVDILTILFMKQFHRAAVFVPRYQLSIKTAFLNPLYIKNKIQT